MFWDTFLVLSLNHFALQATLYQSPPSVAPTTLWHPMKRVRKEFAPSYPVAKVIAINGMTTSFSRDSTKEEYTAGGPPMLKRTRKEIAITQPEGAGDHDNAGSITSITAAKVIADMATLIADKDTATEAPMFMSPLKEIAPCIATNGLPTCSSNNITKEECTAGEPPMLKRTCKEIVMACPEGPAYDVIGHPEGVVTPKYVGGTTSVSGPKTFQQSTQCTNGMLTKAKIDRNEAK